MTSNIKIIVHFDFPKSGKAPHKKIKNLEKGAFNKYVTPKTAIETPPSPLRNAKTIDQNNGIQ